jgi:hypothetical protein
MVFNQIRHESFKYRKTEEFMSTSCNELVIELPWQNLITGKSNDRCCRCLSARRNSSAQPDARLPLQQNATLPDQEAATRHFEARTGADLNDYPTSYKPRTTSKYVAHASIRHTKPKQIAT